jgi:colanic acid/amylovoran biosynthesis protein
MLFEEYGFAEGLLDVTISESEIRQKIDLVIELQSKESIKSIITAKAEELKKLSDQMWCDVFRIIGDNEFVS